MKPDHMMYVMAAYSIAIAVLGFVFASIAYRWHQIKPQPKKKK